MKKSALPIAAPCGESWETMTPEGGGRLCATCDKVVHDLSSMSEARAKRLLASKGNLCVRYLFDERGNVWFAGETPPLAARLLNRAKRGAVLVAALAAPLSLQACMGSMPAGDEPIETTSDAGRAVGQPSVDVDGGDASADDGGDASTDDGGALDDDAAPQGDGGDADDAGL